MKTLASWLVALASLLLAPSAHAEMLLATFKWTNPQPVSLPAEYRADLEVYEHIPRPDSFAFWNETVTALPHSSVADAATVARFDQLLAISPLGELRLRNGPQSYQGQCGWCQLRFLIGDDRQAWLTEVQAAGFDAERLVPRRGPNLAGYEITRMERLVTADAQTILMFGIERDFRVPEPASWLIVLCAVLHVSVLSARSTSSPSRSWCRSRLATHPSPREA